MKAILMTVVTTLVFAIASTSASAQSGSTPPEFEKGDAVSNDPVDQAFARGAVKGHCEYMAQQIVGEAYRMGNESLSDQQIYGTCMELAHVAGGYMMLPTKYKLKMQFGIQ